MLRKGEDFITDRCYYVADLNSRGEVRGGAQEYRYEQLEHLPGAGELIIHFATNIYRTPQEFDVPLPLNHAHLTYRWRASAESAGIATLRCRGELASLSLLASGKDADADRITLTVFQHHLLRELHGTPYEPSFGLLEIKERPLVAVVHFMDPKEKSDQVMLALADRCFAAAYFRYQNLA